MRWGRQCPPHSVGTLVPMGLSIKNERVDALAREAAALTGLTQTGAIEEALIRLLQAYDVDPAAALDAATIAAVREIAAAFRETPTTVPLSQIRAVEDLYDGGWRRR